MEFLFLWSGDHKGARKSRIPSMPAKGFMCVRDENGEKVVPDKTALRAALPFRWRKAFDRATMWSNKHGYVDGPFFWHLCTARGQYITTVYAQPLRGEKPC